MPHHPSSVTHYSSPVEYSVVETALGWIAVAATGAGLRHLILPMASAQQAEDALLQVCRPAVRTIRLSGYLSQRLRRYAAGEAVEFPDRVDLPAAGPFMLRAWALTRTVPRGETRSYKWLADGAGSPRGARAAGQAMAANPVPIVIPCHRIVGSDGGLGGYGGGLDLKSRMLLLEAENRPAESHVGVILSPSRS